MNGVEHAQLRRPLWRLIAFDLDDTLYPEIEYVRSGFKAVAGWIERRLCCDSQSAFRDLIRLYENGATGRVFDQWLEERKYPKLLIQEMVQVYREHRPAIEPFPEVREMLSDLRRESTLGLVSDGQLSVQENKLAALGIQDQFSAVIFSDRYGRDSWKPSSRPFLELLQAVQVAPEEAVYIGDNPAKDFIACRQLGMSSIWLRTATGIYAGLLPSIDGGPDYVVDSLADLRTFLKSGRLVEFPRQS